MRYEPPITDELYSKLNEIIMRHELQKNYTTYPTSKIIKEIIDELDKAGWVILSKLDDIEAPEWYHIWELQILADAEADALERIERIKANEPVYKDDLAKLTELFDHPNN